MARWHKVLGGLFYFSAARKQAAACKNTEHNQMNLNLRDGLIPAIIQEFGTGKVLMLGYMNEQAYEQTVKTGYVTFFSRSRQKLWTKGETSGHKVKLRDGEVDW